MPKPTLTFHPLAGVPDVYVGQSGRLACVALRLRKGELCLYSPVAGLDDQARTALESLGPIAYLLAPNHYHNKALAAYAQSFPEAELVCSDAAAPRLAKVTRLSFLGLDQLNAALADHMRIVQPDGLKTGEVWCDIVSQEQRALVVTDAFSSDTKKPGAFDGTPNMLGTFPTYGVADADTYQAWTQAYLRDCPPTLLVPCHGSPVKSPSLAQDMSALLAERL